MKSKYVHTFLFACPRCELPVAITRVTEEGNWEAVATQTISIQCSYCEATFEAGATAAKRHFVEAWPHQDFHP